MWETVKIKLPSCWPQRRLNLLADKMPDSHSPEEAGWLGGVTGVSPCIVTVVLCAHSTVVSILSFSEGVEDKRNKHRVCLRSGRPFPQLLEVLTDSILC